MLYIFAIALLSSFLQNADACQEIPQDTGFSNDFFTKNSLFNYQDSVFTYAYSPCTATVSGLQTIVTGYQTIKSKEAEELNELLYPNPQYTYLILALNKDNFLLGGIKIIDQRERDYIQHLYVAHSQRGQRIGAHLLQITAGISHARGKAELALFPAKVGYKPFAFDELVVWYTKQKFATIPNFFAMTRTTEAFKQNDIKNLIFC